MKKSILTLAVMLTASSGIVAQTEITEQMLNDFREKTEIKGAAKAIKNALAANDIRTLALNQDNMQEKNTFFSNSVPSKGITNQESSGRCWLFTGMNVLRSKMINEQKLNSMNFSHVYLFFYDQLEKSICWCLPVKERMRLWNMP